MPPQPSPASLHFCIATSRSASTTLGVDHVLPIFRSVSCGQWQPAYIQFGGIEGGEGGIGGAIQFGGTDGGATGGKRFAQEMVARSHALHRSYSHRSAKVNLLTMFRCVHQRSSHVHGRCGGGDGGGGLKGGAGDDGGAGGGAGGICGGGGVGKHGVQPPQLARQ